MAANDQEIASLLIRFRGEFGDLMKNMDDAKAKVQGFGKDSQGTASSIGSAWNTLKDNWMGITAAIYAGYKTIEKGMQLMETGAKAEAVSQSFHLVTQSLGVDGAKLIEDMKAVSGVYVEDTGLMVKAQRLLAEGIKSGDIVKLMEAARVASRLMGKSVEESFDLISEAVISLRTRGLKAAFPMDVTETAAKFAKSIQTVPGLLTDSGQRAAILGEILKQASEKGTMFSEALGSKTNYEKLQTFKSAMAALDEEIGKFALAIGADTVPVMTDFLKNLTVLALRAKEVADAFGGLGAIAGVGFDTALVGLQGLILGISTILNILVKVNTTMLQGIDAITLGRIPAIKKALVDSMQAELDLQDSIDKQTDAINRKVLGRGTLPAETPAPKPTAAPGPEKTGAGKEDINARVLGEKVQKIKLEQEAKTTQTMIEMAQTTANIERDIAIKAAAEKFQTLEVLEDEFAQKMIYIKRDAALAASKAEEDAAVNVVKKEIGETAKAQEAISAVQKTFQVQRDGLILKADEELAAIKLKRAKEQAIALQKAYAEQGAATEYPTEAQTIEMDERSLNLANEKAAKVEAWKVQLLELTGTYHQVTIEMMNQLDVERDQIIAKGHLNSAEEELLRKLYDRKKIELDIDRLLKAQATTAKYGKDLAQMTGNWQDMWKWESEALRVEEQILLKSKDITEVQKELVKQIYLRKQLEAEAMSTMNVPMLTQIGLQKYNIDLNMQMANQWQTLIPNVIGGGADIIGNALMKIADGTTSLSDATKELGKAFGQMVAKMIIDLAMLMLKMAAMQGLKSIFPTLFSGMTIAAAEGGSFWATGPQRLLVGEGGQPELVNIIPLSKLSMANMLPPLKPGQGFASGGSVLTGISNKGGRMGLDLNLTLDQGLVASLKRPTADEIDIVVATKYKTGGHIYKALKER